jgi:hypothetical protein
LRLVVASPDAPISQRLEPNLFHFCVRRVAPTVPPLSLPRCSGRMHPSPRGGIH